MRIRVRVGALAGVLAVAAGIVLAGQAGADSDTPAARAHHALPLVGDTPCTATAAACVDLESRRAWLMRDGGIVRGPVPVGIGGPDTPTPIGHSLRVYRKSEHHVSSESSTNGVPDGMPYAVFFDDGGVAFHAGDPDTFSSGCVKLATQEAKVWFGHLRLGDQVQVLHRSQERTERGLAA